MSLDPEITEMPSMAKITYGTSSNVSYADTGTTAGHLMAGGAAISGGVMGTSGSDGVDGPQGLKEYAAAASSFSWDNTKGQLLGSRRISTAAEAIEGIANAKKMLQAAASEISTQYNCKVDRTYTPPNQNMNVTRIVRVIVADPNGNVPLANRVLHDSGEITTDLDDRELFFEVNIKDKLDKHNEIRAKTLDKGYSKEKGKDMFLEPIRIRDLKMTVITVASF